MRTRALLAVTFSIMLALTGPAAARETMIWSGHTDGYDIRLSSANMTFGRVGEQKPFYSARLRFLNELGPTKPGIESHEISWQLLSVVGPIVSFEQSGGGYIKGTAHPYAYREYHAVDLRRKGLRARLTDYFPPEAIHQALMGDRLVQKALAGKPRPRTLEGLLKALDGYVSDDCTYAFSDDMLKSFAFHHLKGDQVAVRIGLTHGCEAARGSLTILGAYMPIPPKLAGAFADAHRRREGFLMERAPEESAYFEVGTFE